MSVAPGVVPHSCLYTECPMFSAVVLCDTYSRPRTFVRLESRPPPRFSNSVMRSMIIVWLLVNSIVVLQTFLRANKVWCVALLTPSITIVCWDTAGPIGSCSCRSADLSFVSRLYPGARSCSVIV
ncbi:uncharacterized protein K489DRAFT_140076 [Dissoconium aciculare CBS 342.82]|uniref:Uncharacterized protein n=1 Tax=Dissoconium aciculare CBS 342.82 TaxID=1314786 RepID=A0A6J3LT82_9PEZI|nr:uncharacterized protein K489DRAFT_140076 [Dissoconium aciculare CBS 342.82]KAF1817822.1 hypothetical protein K489DRAFT_140076 [Dissoconium aciculare CBS 342.82]